MCVCVCVCVGPEISCSVHLLLRPKDEAQDRGAVPPCYQACPVHSTHSTQDTAHSTLTAHCTLHTAHCTLHTAHCTLHTAHCTLRTAHCTLHTAPIVHRHTSRAFESVSTVSTVYVCSGFYLGFYLGVSRVRMLDGFYLTRGQGCADREEAW